MKLPRHSNANQHLVLLGVGVGISRRCMTSGPPVSVSSIAFIVISLQESRVVARSRTPRSSRPPACPIAGSMPFSSAVHGDAAGYGGRGTSLSTLSSRHDARGGNTFSYPTFCLAPGSSGGELFMIPTFLARASPFTLSTSSGSGGYTSVCHPSNRGHFCHLLPGITGSPERSLPTFLPSYPGPVFPTATLLATPHDL
jgi:hypothetical protein